MPADVSHYSSESTYLRPTVNQSDAAVPDQLKIENILVTLLFLELFLIFLSTLIGQALDETRHLMSPKHG